MTFKGMVYIKRNILSLFTHFRSKLISYCFSVEHKIVFLKYVHQFWGHGSEIIYFIKTAAAKILIVKIHSAYIQQEF